MHYSTDAMRYAGIVVGLGSNLKNSSMSKTLFVDVCAMFSVSTDGHSSMDIERRLTTAIDGSSLISDLNLERDVLSKRYKTVKFLRLVEQ